MPARYLLTSENKVCMLPPWGSYSRTLLGAPGLTTRSKKLLGTKGITTRSKDATRGSWPYY